MLKRTLSKSKRIVSGFIAAVMCMTALSACDKMEGTSMEEATSETTYSEEELNALAQDIPEIVFVFSHNNDNTNIWGYYITNTGEVKMYDFRNIAPDEIYEIPDVYDRLEEATCTEVEFEYCYSSYVVNEKDLGSISKDELLEYYKKLLLVKSSSIKQEQTPIPEDIGHYRYYGVRYNEKGEKEFMLLMCMGSNYDSDISDPYSGEILRKMYSVFPNIL